MRVIWVKVGVSFNYRICDAGVELEPSQPSPPIKGGNQE